MKAISIAICVACILWAAGGLLVFYPSGYTVQYGWQVFVDPLLPILIQSLVFAFFLKLLKRQKA
jgi:hypothetical protein